jgi:hypothetical protein
MDYSYLQEKITADLMNEAGVLTGRIAFTDLYVNEKYFGLYLVEEDFDHTFFKNRGHDLVKYYTIGKNIKQYGNLLSFTNLDQRRQVSLITRQLFNNSLSVDYLNSKFYFESFVRMDLINTIAGNNDGFPRNNFLIYQSPVSKKWIPIAHDFDLTFRYPPDYSFKGHDRCVIYRKLLDEMIPIFKGKILDHINELVQIVNSSISHHYKFSIEITE